MAWNIGSLFGPTGTAWNEESRVWSDWNGFELRMLVFGLIGMA
jgi:hypothetical protein